jgi:putative flippase GtrA
MSIWQQLTRFIIVGGLNTIVGFSLYAAFIYLNLDYALAVFLATLLGILFNFKTTGKLVFNNAKNSLFYKFVGVYAIGYFFNVGLIKLLQLLTQDLYWSGFFSLIPVALLTFVLNKFLVFKDTYEIN